MHKTLMMLLITTQGFAIGGCSKMGPTEKSGAIVGGVAGAMMGSQFGHGAGRLLGAGIGAATGAIIGDRVGQSMDQDRPPTYLTAVKLAKHSLKKNTKKTPGRGEQLLPNFRKKLTT
jgi:uncharacterized protein YcfJ